MFKIKKNFFINLAYSSIFLSIIFRALSIANQDTFLRNLGYLFQAFVLLCYILYGLITLKRCQINSVNIILMILIIYQCIISLAKHSFLFPNTLLDVLTWPLSIIVYYNFSYQGTIPNSMRVKTWISYAFLCAISFKLISILMSGISRGGQVIFPTYYCLTLLPLMLVLTEQKKYRYLCIIFCIVVLFASTKRAGTLALISSLFSMGIIEAHIQGTLNRKWKKYLYLFLVICIGSILLIYLEKEFQLSIFKRFSTIFSDGGSGRDEIWKITLRAYKNSDLMDKIFGHGFQSVYYQLRPQGLSRFAHNSYLEYLYDYGILGLILLVSFEIALIDIEFKLIKNKSKYAPVMGMMLVITIFLSLFSYFFEESNIIQPMAIAYGVILGLAYNEGRLI